MVPLQIWVGPALCTFRHFGAVAKILSTSCLRISLRLTWGQRKSVKDQASGQHDRQHNVDFRYDPEQCRSHHSGQNICGCGLGRAADHSWRRPATRTKPCRKLRSVLLSKSRRQRLSRWRMLAVPSADFATSRGALNLSCGMDRPSFLNNSASRT